jgi:potassium channel subfamily K
MFLPALVYPFHRLFSHKDEKNAPGPGKVPAASEEQNGTNNNLRSPQSTLNAYIFPSSISHNPQNRHPILESDQPPARTRAVVPHITIENPAASSQDDSIRVLPLISSVFVPFAILLAIPGLTDHWYIRTNDQHQTVGFEANPLYIQVMLGFSMACAIITNACLVIRLCEKMVKNMTILCIVALSIHGMCSPHDCMHGWLTNLSQIH